MHTGTCLCGGVRYALDVQSLRIELCHCRSCRKSNGSAYGANASVAAAAFRVIEGAALLREFESSPGKQRVFCSRCGSPVFSRNQTRPDQVRIRIGLLDTPLAQSPAFHFMVAHKAEWETICDDLPQYEGFEPARA